MGPLTSKELLEAEQYWIQNEQEKFFPEELKYIKEKKNHQYIITNHSKIKNKILRLGKRLHFNDLTTEEKHPVILLKHSWLKRLIVSQEHKKLMHRGILNSQRSLACRKCYKEMSHLLKVSSKAH